jgi:hypothetical protein
MAQFSLSTNAYGNSTANWFDVVMFANSTGGIINSLGDFSGNVIVNTALAFSNGAAVSNTNLVPVDNFGIAVNAEQSAASNGAVAKMVTDLVGKAIVLPYANPENFVSGTITSAQTGTSSVQLIASPGAGLRNYITTIIVSNGLGANTEILIQDGSSGTTLAVVPAPANYLANPIHFPVPLRQVTTGNGIYIAPVVTGANVKISAVGYKGV